MASPPAILRRFIPDPAPLGAWSALLGAGSVAVLVAYFFHGTIAALVSRHVRETALGLMVLCVSWRPGPS